MVKIDKIGFYSELYHLQMCILVMLVYISFLLLWPWPRSNDLDIQTQPRYSEDVPAYRKWSFAVKALDSTKKTDRCDRRHYHQGCGCYFLKVL